MILWISIREWYVFYKLEDLKDRYDRWEFQEILDNSHWILQKNSVYLHNLWNTSYELYNPEEKNIETLEISLEYFKKSLALWENEKTRMNYDIVASLLQDEQQNPEQEKEDSPQELETQQQQDSQDSEDSEDSEDSQAQNQDTSQNSPRINQRDEEYRIQESEEIEKLTPQEQQEIEQKIEQLRQDQQYNQNAFNKKPQEGNFNNIFDMFFENQVWWEQKDW